MSLLAPFFLVLSILALPILLMYMLKLRRRQVSVSSTLLWQAVLRDRQANTPWHKLRRNLLLFLQLLILAGMIISLARPAMAIPSISAGSIVVVLDASASMNATDVPPSRFEAARDSIESIIEGLSGGARMTLIEAGYQPVVLASSETDHLELNKALQNARVSNGPADWETALALAAGAASAEAGEQPAAILIVSDGGLPDSGLPPMPGEVRYLPIGKSADNLAITALATRTVGNSLELFANLSNYSGQPRQVLVSFYRDGELIHAQSVDLADQATISLPNLAPGAAIFEARLEPASPQEEPLDALLLDNAAFAVSQGLRNRRILLVTKENFFLEQVLSALPEVTAFRALPTKSALDDAESSFQLPEETFDLYILDGVIPQSAETSLPALPAGNLLFINPPPTALFNVTGTFTETQAAQVHEHSLTQYVDWSNVHIAKARFVNKPAWAETLVGSPEYPLVFAGETEGRRIAALTFDLHDSDLPLQIAFPILFSNLVNYLAPIQAVRVPDNLQPGESVTILPGVDVAEVAIASPEGRIFSLQPKEESLTFSETGELGIYAVNFLKEKTQSAEFFAVNLFNESESNILPKENIQLGRTRIIASEQEKLGKRELWPWFALAALFVLVLEWWVYHRRP